MILKHFVDNILKQAWALFCKQLNGFKYCKSQFNICHLFAHTVCSIWPDRTLLGATTLGQSGPGSNGNERVLCISWIFLPSDGLMSYPGHLLGWGCYSSGEMQSVYSTAPVHWTCMVCLRWTN